MILDKDGLVKYIQNWITVRAGAAKVNSLVVGVSGGVDSAVVYLLCKGTPLDVYPVMMPCHSSPDGIERAKELLKDDDKSRLVNLESAFFSVREQVNFGSTILPVNNAADGALRSCLRAPVLDYVAKINNGIIVGTGNRDEDEITRYYQKRGDGAVDISPIAQLHKSEVYELAVHLGVPESILKAIPSADLWGPEANQEDEKELGMTYAEIEQATKLVSRMYNNTEARAFNHLADLLSSQKLEKQDNPKFVENLRTLGAMEQSSRHKHNPNLPVCPIRGQGLTYITE